MARLRNATVRNTCKGMQESPPTGVRKASQREDDEGREEAEEGYRQEVVVDYEGRRAVGQQPEEDKGEDEGNGEEGCEAVG